LLFCTQENISCQYHIVLLYALYLVLFTKDFLMKSAEKRFKIRSKEV
jgi:hypothetical protein